MLVFSKKYTLIAVGLCLFLIAFSIALSWFLDVKKREVQQGLEDRISLLHEKLVSDVGSTGNNQADSEIAQLIKDCSQREEYDKMLSKLNGLHTAIELNQAMQLHNACGDFFALRKRIMVSKMQMLLDELDAMEHMYRTYSGAETYVEVLSVWKSIIEVESARAQLLSAQAELQGEIIQVLAKNPRADLHDRLSRAQDIAQRLEVQYIQSESKKKEEGELWSRIESGR